jgi:hypothetical protein
MSLFGGNTAGHEGANINSYWQQWGVDNSLAQLENDHAIPFHHPGAAATTYLSRGLGFEGPQQAQAVRSMFQESPGYQFQMDQGLEAIKRAAAGRGTLAGGQTSMDLMKFGQGLANSEWGNYLGRLENLSRTGLAAAGLRQQRDMARAGVYQPAAESIGKGWIEGLKSDETANNQGQANLLSGILGGVKLLTGFAGGFGG